MKSALAALAALGQEHRLSIFRLLVQAGPAGLAAGEIGRALALAPATLSFHLKDLTHAGMIAPVSRGRHVVYSADFDQMNALLAFLSENCCQGNPSACRPPARKPSRTRGAATAENGNRRRKP